MEARSITLKDGTILIVGGHDASNVLKSCEIYDPALDKWTLTDSLHTQRFRHEMQLLPDGRVLAFGGLTNLVTATTATAEIYDPLAGRWLVTGSMHDPREGHASCVLGDGKVMTVSGLNANTVVYLYSCETYDASTGAWTYVASAPSALSGMAALYSPILNKVFMCSGGTGSAGIYSHGVNVYDVSSNSWTSSTPLVDAHVNCDRTSSIASSGKLYLFGGRSGTSSTTSRVEYYDIGTQSWLQGGFLSMSPWQGLAYEVLPDSFLVVGGVRDPSFSTVTDSTNWFGVKSNSVNPGPLMLTARFYGCGSVLHLPSLTQCFHGGAVLVFGGRTNGNQIVASCERLEFGQYLQAALSGSDTLVLCQGDTTTLRAKLNSPDSAVVVAHWYDGPTSIPAATGFNYHISDTVSPGTHLYFMFATDTNGCAVSTDSCFVTVRARPVLTMGAALTICGGTGLNLPTTVTSGAPPYHFKWTPSYGLNNDTILQPFASPSSTTRYKLVVTDVNGCMNADSLLVTVNPAPVISLGPARKVCSGFGIPIGAPATGGTPPFLYQWSPATGLSSTTVAIPFATPLVTTKYTATVTDARGCQAHDTITLSVNQAPQVKAGGNITICQFSPRQIGGLATGQAAPFSYQWSPTLGLSSPTIARPLAGPSVTTTYYVTVTDTNGCQARDSVIVSVHPAPSANPGRDSTICAGSPVTLGLPATGGTPPYRYDWYPAAGLSSNIIEQPTATPTATTKYTMTVTDVNGCQSSSDVTITVPESHLDIHGPLSVCLNSGASYSTTGISGGLYQWVLSGGGSISGGATSTSAQVQWVTAGHWGMTLKQTNTLGCEKDTTVVITVDSSLSVPVVPTGPITLCNGDTVVLHAGEGFTSYAWSDGSSKDSLVVTKSGSYGVSVVGSGGCMGTSIPTIVNVSSTPKPSPVILAPSLTFCEGDSIVLSTTQSYRLYYWSDSESAASIVVKKAGSYQVTVTDSNGCSGASSIISVSSVPKPVAAITPSGPIKLCEGETTVLTASGGASYFWSDSERTPSIVVSKTGSYWVGVSNGNGCVDTSTPIQVTVNPSLHPVISGPVAVCPNSRSIYNVSGVSDQSDLWRLVGGNLAGGVPPNQLIVDWGAAGTGSITYTATDTLTGCSGSASLDITIDNTLVPQITSDGPAAFCAGDSVKLDGGAGYATYQWQLGGVDIPGQSSETMIAKSSGDYAVQVSNGGSCSGASKVFTVTVYPQPIKPVISLQGVSISSTPAATYSWKRNDTLIPGATTQVITPSEAALFTVTITDANGCSATSDPFDFTSTAKASVALGAYEFEKVGLPVSIPLTMENSSNLLENGAATYVAKIRFDNALLAPTGATPVGIVVGTDRIIRVSDSVRLTSGLLQTLHFTALESADSCTPVIIDSFYFPHANVDVTKTNGVFCIAGPCGPIFVSNGGKAFWIRSIRPNPSLGEFTIDYQLTQEGQTLLALEDVLGRSAKVLKNNWMAPGEYHETYQTQDISSGTYRLVLRSPSGSVSRLMQMLK